MRTRPIEKKDLLILNVLNMQIINLRIEKVHNFTFKMDSGDKDNAIEFFKKESGMIHVKPPMGVVSSQIYIPDLLDCDNKRIIEYNETPVGSRNHNKRKKGHVDESDYDMTKMDTYKKAGFNVLVIYDFDIKYDLWKDKLLGWLTE